MADPRFFDRAGPSLSTSLAELTGARLLHSEEAGRVCADVAPLETAGPGDLTFLENRKYTDAFVACRAEAAFVEEGMVPRAPVGMALLVAKDPYKAFARAAQAFYPATPVTPRRRPPRSSIPAAAVPEDCDIGALCRDRGRGAARCRLPDRRRTA